MKCSTNFCSQHVSSKLKQSVGGGAYTCARWLSAFYDTVGCRVPDILMQTPVAYPPTLVQYLIMCHLYSWMRPEYTDVVFYTVYKSPQAASSYGSC